MHKTPVVMFIRNFCCERLRCVPQPYITDRNAAVPIHRAIANQGSRMPRGHQ